MIIHYRTSVGIVLAVLFASATASSLADNFRRGDNSQENVRRDKGYRDGTRHDNDSRSETRHDDGSWNRARPTETRQKPPGYVLDNRHQHNHYYPPRGFSLSVLPREHRIIPYRGVNYYYHGGVWYRPSGSRFVVIVPPVGVVVPILPPFYTTIWIGGLPYYYAAGVYYTWRPEENGYVVTTAPPESEVFELPAVPDQLFVYPMKGQSDQQLATDRYECHRWAVGQTGFDPTQSGDNAPESQNAGKHADYRRALKACLEARGYSVQ